jgi:hypothetical protein
MSNQQIQSLFSENPAAWLNVLPKFQEAIIEELKSSGLDYEEISELWVSASTENTFKFGVSNGGGEKSTFYKQIKKELRSYLCDEDKYKENKEELFGKGGVSRDLIVSAISIGISQHLGVSAGALSPVVVLILIGLGSISLNAWCAVTK